MSAITILLQYVCSTTADFIAGFVWYGCCMQCFEIVEFIIIMECHRGVCMDCDMMWFFFFSCEKSSVIDLWSETKSVKWHRVQLQCSSVNLSLNVWTFILAGVAWEPFGVVQPSGLINIHEPRIEYSNLWSHFILNYNSRY